ncbi:MAG: GNAT family N-acetyltransferase [Peptostreptococcaceae bacterium]|jgi:ribosomal protein S18 acetylase RimI-like enzyme|nr:GNAT family N-acetyltransferase [Peptostreptococcaceae bacterium]
MNELKIDSLSEMSLYMRILLLKFLNEKSGERLSYEDMIKFYEGSLFENGKSFFVAYKENVILSTLGVVKKEIKKDNIAYISRFFIENIKAKNILFDKLYKKATKDILDDVDIRLGAFDNSNVELLENYGFKNTYNMIRMELDLENITDVKEGFLYEDIKACDEEIYLDINNRAFEGSKNASFYDSNDYKEVLNSIDLKNKVKMVTDDNKKIGFLHLKKDEDKLYIDTFAIKKEEQGKGYGKRVLKDMLTIVKEKEFKTVSLDVMNDNKRAMNLYEKLGFENKKISRYWFSK